MIESDWGEALPIGVVKGKMLVLEDIDNLVDMKIDPDDKQENPEFLPLTPGNIHFANPE